MHRVDKILQDFVLSNDDLRRVTDTLLIDLKKGLAASTHTTSTVKMFPTYVRDIPNGSEKGKFFALDLGGSKFRVLRVDLNGQFCNLTGEVYDIPQSIMEAPGDVLFDHIAACLVNHVSKTDPDKNNLSKMDPEENHAFKMEHGKENYASKMDSDNEYCSKMASDDKQYPVSKTGPDDKNHVSKVNPNKIQHLHLGFTFSFPCLQRSLTGAVLTGWTKGFACSGVVGKDVAQMLREAIERRKDSAVEVHVIAVINDTTGTLMSCAHRNRDCRIGLIVGTGCNACYMEKLEEVETWTGDRNHPDQVIINTEWGAFGNDGCLDFFRTSFDSELDQHSKNKGEQLFEKMISGMYLGEIVRIIVAKLANDSLLFQGHSSQEFNTPFRFKTKYISDIESDSSGSVLKTTTVLEKMGVPRPSREDCEVLRRVCESVSLRSAYLVSAAVSALLVKMGRRDKTVVGVDGSVYRHHPKFKGLMEGKMAELSEYPFELMLSEDGSGRGAALVAAVASRMDPD